MTRGRRRQPQTAPAGLDPRLYSPAQVAASEGRLPDDHPAWRMQDPSDEGERRREQIRSTQQRLLAYLQPDESIDLLTVARTSGQDATEVRRAVWSWVDGGRAEWVDGNLDRLRLLVPARSLLTSPKVPARTDRPVTYGCGCGTRWSALDVAHCAVCHLTFTSAGPFEEHRTGDTHPRDPAKDTRRCRTPDELRERGMEPNDKGWWRRPRPADTLPGRK